MGNKLVTRVRNVFGKKSKSETRAIETAKVKKMTTRSIQTPESHSVPDIVAEKQSKVVEPSAIVSALQVDNLGGLEVSLLDNLGNFSRNGSRYVPKPVSTIYLVKFKLPRLLEFHIFCYLKKLIIVI